MLELILVLAALTVFLLFTGIAMPLKSKHDSDLPVANLSQFAPANHRKGKLPGSIAIESMRRAMVKDSTNARYLRHLKQANWYWEPGEPALPNPKAPFWNLETLWGKKYMDMLTYGGFTAIMVMLMGVVLSLIGVASFLIFVLVAVGAGAIMGMMGFTSPDSAVAGAAANRQRELTLEMGFRIPELRADVMAGNTIQRAIRNMSRRPGGPFIEELRHAVVILDVTKDDTLAMDQLITRNEGNELLIEFANNLKLVSRQGGQIGPVLNVLADLAQQRLRLNIQGQARKNLQAMTRPIGLSNLIVTAMLIIAPAVGSVMGGVSL